MRSAETEEAFRRFAFLGGVTTVRSMADDAVALAELAKNANESAVESPRIYFAALFGGPSLILKDRRIAQISHGRLPGEAPRARAITASTDIDDEERIPRVGCRFERSASVCERQPGAIRPEQ